MGCEAFPEGTNITPLPQAMEIVERTAKHFFELGEKTVPSPGGYREGFNAGVRECQNKIRDVKDAMKEQMGEQARKELFKDDLTLADLVAFDEGCKIGRRLERQDMFKDAVDGTYAVTTVGHFAFIIDKPIKDLCFGDKVKIVIAPIKED